MNITILKRSTFLKSIITFVLFYFFYIYCLKCVSSGQSFLSLTFLERFILDHFVIVFLTFFAVLNLWKIGNYSKYIFLAFSVTSFLVTIKMYYTTSNKLVLLMGFVGMIISAFFYMGLSSELEESIYNPAFTENDLYLNTLEIVRGEVSVGHQKFDGQLTSWSINCCFFYLGDNNIENQTNVKMYLNFLGSNFEFEGKVVTKNNKGIGIIFSKKVELKKWEQLLSVLKDRGYVV